MGETKGLLEDMTFKLRPEGIGGIQAEKQARLRP